MKPSVFWVGGAIVVGIIAVSTASIFIRFAQENAPSLVIAAFRLTIATLVLLPVVLAGHRRELAGLSAKEIGLGLGSGIFLALHFATWISSLEYTTVAGSVVLVSTIPLWVAIVSPLVLQERVVRQVWIGMIIAMAGGIVVALGQSVVAVPGKNPLWGNFLALCGAWAAAGYLLIGRKLRSSLSLVVYIFIVYGAAALVLLSFVGVAGLSLVGYPKETYLWMIVLALVPQLLGHSTFNWALGHLPASFVSITLLGEPIGSTILAIFLLREIPSGMELIGEAAILVGIAVAASRSSSTTGD
ncbi:MAG: DMT family transporter [Thermodesulfobacteriota bacterium]